MPTKRQVLLGLAAGAAGASIRCGGLGAMPTPANPNGAEGVYYDTPNAERISVAQALKGEQADRFVSVPTDFATLQDAIDTLSNRPVRRGSKIILNIESGHSPATGIEVADGDYGRFWIQSVDAEVTLNAAWPDAQNFMKGVNARMPVLDCLINAGSKGLVGIWANNGSTVYVTIGSGIKNWGAASGLDEAGQALRIAHGSTAVIGETVFTGAATNGLRATNGATVFCSGADFSNAGAMALMISRGSLVSGHDMTLTGAGTVAVRAARSFVSVHGSDCQNAGEYGIWAFEGSVVSARGVNCSGAGIDGIHAFQGGAIVEAEIATVSNCTGRGVLASEGAKIILSGATINSNGTTGISATDGSEVICPEATISGNVGRALWVTDGASVHARDVVIDATGSSATNVVDVARGGYVNLTSATITNAPTNGVNFAHGSRGDLVSASVTGSGTKDFILETGSIVSAHNCTTSTSGTSGNTPDSADVTPSTFNAISTRGILFA